jgi:hypothetical protein
LLIAVVLLSVLGDYPTRSTAAGRRIRFSYRL